MQKIFIYFLKGFKKTRSIVLKPFDFIFTWFTLYANGVKFSSFKSNGCPRVHVIIKGKCTIGKDFKMNNRPMANPIGRFQRCCIIVGKMGELKIGNKVGMSSTTIVCHDSIFIEDNVKMGGNVVIYDTDFHSLNAEYRIRTETDIARTAPVLIKKNAFIGAHTTILKGVTIGENSVVGACSVVTKNIPDNEVWGGNPAKMIKCLKVK